MTQHAGHMLFIVHGEQDPGRKGYAQLGHSDDALPSCSQPLHWIPNQR